MTTAFGITFDYLCPFARNANEHVVAGLQAGADWDVTFTPYSLAQGHVEAGDPDVWEAEDPASVSGILAFQVGLAVRDHFPDHFLDAHVALFAARHDEGADMKDAEVLRRTLTSVGLDADAVFDVVRTGEPLETLRKEHEAGGGRLRGLGRADLHRRRPGRVRAAARPARGRRLRRPCPHRPGGRAGRELPRAPRVQAVRPPV